MFYETDVVLVNTLELPLICRLFHCNVECQIVFPIREIDSIVGLQRVGEEGDVPQPPHILTWLPVLGQK
jgi:hypothetical protein